ncbi:MAG: class I SAM-dependent methyltransferase, partial [Paraburkholderia sp.]|uniref:class I SAM-dependent methyltransferase n=1 Tax=Paraburkholderia sp. TaxID=1926495 RepID=UPI00397BE67D
MEFRLSDYRNLNRRFDRIASGGMLEHVGPKNYRTYMEVAYRCRMEYGLFLLDTIRKNRRGTAPDRRSDRYIFPAGVPAISDVGNSMSGFLVVEDLHNFGSDYDRTQLTWHARFEEAWPHFARKMGHRFSRIGRYYLLWCTSAFRAISSSGSGSCRRMACLEDTDARQGDRMWRFVSMPADRELSRCRSSSSSIDSGEVVHANNERHGEDLH